jgi:hypothetical protein
MGKVILKDVGARLPGPETVTRFTSRFGCCEMEMAAKRIVSLARSSKKKWNVQFSMYNMGKNELAQRGLFMLALHGWLVPGYPNGGATVNRAFVKRITEP